MASYPLGSLGKYKQHNHPIFIPNYTFTMEISNPNITRSGLYSTLGLNPNSSTGNASETPQVLTLLASVLEQTIDKSEKLLKKLRTKDKVTMFHGSREASLSIRLYINRVFKYSKCSPSCFVVAYVYMERFLSNTNGYLTLLNVHRLLIACVLVAAKFLEHVNLDNTYYAKIGGISTSEMNKLEPRKAQRTQAGLGAADGSQSEDGAKRRPNRHIWFNEDPADMVLVTVNSL